VSAESNISEHFQRSELFHIVLFSPHGVTFTSFASLFIVSGALIALYDAAIRKARKSEQ
jgi:hypothetical protein